MTLALLLAPGFSDSKRIAQRNADNPHAKFSAEALDTANVGGCYNAPTQAELRLSAERAPFSFTEEELAAAKGPVSVDWRKEGAVGPVQQQHPFGTCWAFSMTAVTEAVAVIQGKHKYEKLSEQMVVSCVPESACGDNSDVLWSWALHNTGGKFQSASSEIRTRRLTRRLTLRIALQVRPSIPTIARATSSASSSSRPTARPTATQASATCPARRRTHRARRAPAWSARTARPSATSTRARASRRPACRAGASSRRTARSRRPPAASPRSRRPT